jgi:hypothetical protein
VGNNNFSRFYSATGSSANVNVTVADNNIRKVSIGLPPKSESRTSSQRFLIFNLNHIYYYKSFLKLKHFLEIYLKGQTQP